MSTEADWSGSPPAIQTILATIPANPARTNFTIQNQSAAVLQLILDHPYGNPTIFLVSPLGAISQHDCLSLRQLGTPHPGQIRIAGAAGSQFAAAEY